MPNLPFSRSKASYKLNKILHMPMSYTFIDIHTNFTNTIDEFKIETFKEFLFRQQILEWMISMERGKYVK